MALYNMQCPVCGSDTTNYDGRKTWKCLSCRNELVLQEDINNYNTSINVHSKALYDFDIGNSKPFKTHSQKMIMGHNQVMPYSKWVWVLSILGVYFFWGMFANIGEGNILSAIWIGWLSFLLIIPAVILGNITKKVPIYEDLIWMASYCPNCEGEYNTYQNNYSRDEDWDKGLTHCHS